MNEYQIARSMFLYLGKTASAKAPIAKALKQWALNNLSWLDFGVPNKTLKSWDVLVDRFSRWSVPDTPPPYAIQLSSRLADLLDLDGQNRQLLSLLIACDRLPRVRGLAHIATNHGHDLAMLLGALCSAKSDDAIGFVRRSPVLRLGLVGFATNRYGKTEIDIQWTLSTVLDRAPTLGPGLVDALIGPRQTTSLGLEDFEHIADAPFMRNLILGAMKEQAKGINILIHGPPGTGKTELARVLASSAHVQLHGVGEADEDGEEPSRYDRVSALALAQRVLNGTGKAVLLFDEMEDFIGNTRRAGGNWMAQRDGSKVFVNRLLETNAVPIIWTTNTIDNVDDAILRRMSYVLRMDYPSRQTSTRIYAHIARDEQIAVSPKVQALIDAAPETATILRNAARASRLAGAKSDADTSALSLVKALRGGVLPPLHDSAVDLALYETERPLAAVFDQIASGRFLDVSLLLSGPPGTGKTALAHHLAKRLDRPLLEKRASDLLSKWVGETEANIADAFLQARTHHSVLFFDEADTLMADRTSAGARWEVGQVNELLSWLDRHDYPVVAATNNAARLDAAALRRFDFKIELRPLGSVKARQAFKTFFKMDPPAGLDDLKNLTPGDFHVVKKQLRHLQPPSVDAAFGALRRESILKPDTGQKIGF